VRALGSAPSACGDVHGLQHGALLHRRAQRNPVDWVPLLCEVRVMNAVTHDVQARLGIEVVDESLLISHLLEDSNTEDDVERAIVWAITTALDSPVLRDLISSYGLAVRRGEVRSFTPIVATVMPGSGLEHSVAQAAEPLTM
jgi:hypothetical protein